MEFPKDIIVFIEEENGRNKRLAYAVNMAERWGAHVIATFVEEDITLSPSNNFARGKAIADMLQHHAQRMQMQEQEARTLFESLLTAHRLTGEWRIFKNEDRDNLMLHARHASLAIMGPPSPQTRSPRTLALAEEIIFTSGRPTLLVPTDWPEHRVPETIVIGWNMSCEATRAISAAMPFLCAARNVQIVVIPDERTARLQGQEPGMDICTHLSRHGVPVTLERLEGEDAGELLMDHCRRINADMLVVGACSRMKISELIFGGVTRTVFHMANIPILVSS